MSHTTENNSETESGSTEYDSDDESSHENLEYHSGQEPESERQQIILVNRDEEFTFLNIRFPMPHRFPHPYIQLNNLMSHVDSMVPKSYSRIESITGDPQCALGYIIHHFNIERVSKSLRTIPNYCFDQVYYSTYIDTLRFDRLQEYYKVTKRELLLKLEKQRVQDALANERLEIQLKYGRYLVPDELPITLMDCIL